jgi:hypothetical protein
MNNLKRNRYRDKTVFLGEHKTLFLILLGLVGLASQAIKLWENFNSDSELVWILQAIAFFLAILYFYVVGKEDGTKRARDEFIGYIENKRNLEKLLSAIFENQIQDYNFKIFESEYNSSILLWYNNSDGTNKVKYFFKLKQNVQSFIDDIGVEDFSYLLLTKAENMDFIKVNDSDEKIIIHLLFCS